MIYAAIKNKFEDETEEVEKELNELDQKLIGAKLSIKDEQDVELGPVDEEEKKRRLEERKKKLYL